ncbi:hypothetical protein SAMN04487965_0529 [Microbulbifer donghaiensis]|uniref:Uncharacterized protein n=1 Tax=Microbulbifer donghaiensis TaxID=494016 RepID=A0A1M4VVS6_9GAMM|nr:hypothetical protein SAMN04487965_0529 [Microbulbifer donghaiensis]
MTWCELRKMVGAERDWLAFERLFHHFAALIEGFHHSRAPSPSTPKRQTSRGRK